MRLLELAAGGYQLRIGLCGIQELRPHEAVLEEEVRRLASSIERSGVQMDPVIVDSGTCVILDGAHRFEALRRLGARAALVSAVDYGDEAISVSRWLRGFSPAGAALEISKELGLGEGGSWREAASAVDRGEAEVAVLMPEGPSLVGAGGGRGVEAYWRAKAIEDALRRSGASVEMVDDSSLEAELSRGFAVIYVASPSKDDVIRSGLGGRLYPPKSTKHTFKARPLGVYMPLGHLMAGDEGEGLEFIRKAASRYRVLPPGSEYAGRRYSEPLIVFGADRREAGQP